MTYFFKNSKVEELISASTTYGNANAAYTLTTHSNTFVGIPNTLLPFGNNAPLYGNLCKQGSIGLQINGVDIGPQYVAYRGYARGGTAGNAGTVNNGTGANEGANGNSAFIERINVPEAVTKIKGILVGGGGGGAGASASNNTNNGFGGGAGGICWFEADVESVFNGGSTNTTIDIYIGNGGQGGNGTNRPGNSGEFGRKGGVGGYTAVNINKTTPVSVLVYGGQSGNVQNTSSVAAVPGGNANSIGTVTIVNLGTSTLVQPTPSVSPTTFTYQNGHYYTNWGTDYHSQSLTTGNYWGTGGSGGRSSGSGYGYAGNGGIGGAIWLWYFT